MSAFLKSIIWISPHSSDSNLISKWRISKHSAFIVPEYPQSFSNQLCRTLMSWWFSMDLQMSILQKRQDPNSCLQWVWAMSLTTNGTHYFYPEIFNRLISVFGFAFRNMPESIIKGRITTKGRMKYYFKMIDSITALFIETKTRSCKGHLDAIAQVIAECDG